MRLLFIFCLLLSSYSSSWSETGTQIQKGVINGAKYTIAAPANPKGKLILFAHGYRPVKFPLSSDFSINGTFTKNLLADGWIIASTSYRRNGWIIEDALEDIKALRKKVRELYGKPSRCIIIGSSMGGLITTLAAEGFLDNIHGAIAIGAALQNYPKPEFYPTLKFAPKAPILFLTNQTELHYPTQYCKRANSDKTAMWTIKRPGHCNVSDFEKWNALTTLDAWIDGKKIDLKKDGTIPPVKLPSTAQKNKHGLQGKITHINASWGNITTSFTLADVHSLKLKLKDSFIVKSPSSKLKVTLAQHYSELPAGAPVAFVTPNGYLRVQINRQSAAQVLKVKINDPISIQSAKE